MFITVSLSSINLCPYVIYRNVTEPVEWQAFFNVSVLLCLCVNFLLVKTVPKLALVKSICLKNQNILLVSNGQKHFVQIWHVSGRKSVK